MRDTSKKKLIIGSLIAIMILGIIVGVTLYYNYITARLRINTNIVYIIDSIGKEVDITDTLDETKTHIELGIKDTDRITEYKDNIVNLIPLVFDNEELNNNAIKYYLKYDGSALNLKEESNFSINYKEGKGNISENFTAYLLDNYKDLVLGNKELDTTLYMVIMDSAVGEFVANHNATATEVQNAKVVIDESENNFIVLNEVQGTYLDKITLLNDISYDNFPIDLKKYYEDAEIVSTDLLDLCDKMNDFVNWSVTYKNGVTIKASVNDLKLNKNNEIVLKYDFITDGLNEVAKQYNTVGKKKKFKTHNGSKIEVGGTSQSTWGSVVNTEKELEYLKTQYENCTSVSDRTPEYIRKQEQIGKTYVEVSISEQHVWVYKNGKRIMDTSCVTGTKGVHDTPKGLYYISECINGKYLVGDGYKTWVNKWMRLTNRGVGLHDATWRSNFGGNIYSYSGSHGCVNLPMSFASKLFKEAYTGMPVVIY